MAASVHIIAHGARTPVGLVAPASAAAVRAGISRLREHPFLIDGTGEPIVCGLAAGIDPELAGVERMLAIAEPALREACRPLGAALARFRELPLFLGLPEKRPGFTNRDVDQVVRGLERVDGLPVRLSRVTPLADGHASGLAAFGAALEQVRSGAVEACLVGGVDSYIQGEMLGWLDGHKQLLREGIRSGFPPGEAAGFCLLMSQTALKHLGLASLGVLRAVGVGHESQLIKTDDICLGQGLTAAVRNAVSGLALPGEKVSDIVCDVNGERYRGEEWGFVCLQLASYFDDPTGYRTAVSSWGDAGAASGPLSAILACQAAARGYAKGPRTLVWASSERGLRVAALIDQATSGLNRTW